MHYRVLVTFDQEEADDHEQARQFAYDTLVEDCSFVGGGRFSTAYADWLVVGGRWSDYLSSVTWAREVLDTIHKREAEEGLSIRGTFYPREDMQDRQAALKAEVEALYAQHLPDDYKPLNLPYDRNQYLDTGYPDDAMMVTERLYDTCLAQWEGQDLAVEKFLLVFADLNYDPINRDKFIGQKWLVVIDAHM